MWRSVGHVMANKWRCRSYLNRVNSMSDNCRSKWVSEQPRLETDSKSNNFRIWTLKNYVFLNQTSLQRCSLLSSYLLAYVNPSSGILAKIALTPRFCIQRTSPFPFNFGMLFWCCFWPAAFRVVISVKEKSSQFFQYDILSYANLLFSVPKTLSIFHFESLLGYSNGAHDSMGVYSTEQMIP